MAERDIKVTAATIPVVDTEKDTIFVGLDSGLSTGDKRTYDKSGGTKIDGLDDNHDYFVRVEDGGKIKLYDTEEHARAGGTEGLADLKTAGSGNQKLKWAFDSNHYLVVPSGDVNFAAGTDVHVLQPAEGSQLDTGDAVHYAAGGTSIPELNGTDTYYVIILDDKNAELAASRQDALDGKAIHLSGAGNVNQKLVDSTDSFRTDAKSGAGVGKIGVAGSVGLNNSKVHTHAIVGYNPDPAHLLLPAVQVTLTGGNVDIQAESRTENFVDTAPSAPDGTGGSSVGVGASFSLNIALNDTLAEVEAGQMVTGNTGHFIVTASGDNTAITSAENGSKSSGGGTQIGAAVAIAVVNNTTH